MSEKARPRRSRARPSIVDVAARAGVSVATVSRALRGMANVSAQTRERVVRAAGELDYTVSPLASGLVTGRTRSIGVVAPYAGRWFFAEVLRGLDEGLRDHGYDLVLHVLADAERRARFFAELPLRRRVDAVAVVALPLSAEEIAVLNALHLPLASVGEPVNGMHQELIDHVAAARLAVQHLLNLGHRRVAMIGGDPAGPEHLRVPGLRARGYHEVMSGGALRALRRSGLRCPDDVSVIGIDDHELAETFDVTTVAQPVAAQGEAAARWLIDALDGAGGTAGGDGSGTCRHEVRLVLRGTTGPP